MEISLIIIFAVSFFALLMSAFFSAAEVAIFSIRPANLRILRGRHKIRVAWIHEVLAQPRRFLVTLLLGNVMANATVACGFVFLCHQLYPSSWKFAGWAPIIIATGVLLLFGELIPKAIATRKVIPVALYTIGLVRTFERVLHPFTGRMEHLSQKMIAWMIPPSVRPLSGLTEDEYLTMLDVGTREGSVRPSEKRLIERTLQLANRNLRELMIPRSEMCCLDSELEFDEMKKYAVSARHRRLPIYSGSLDSIVGILNVRRFLLETEGDMIACIEPPPFVPETMTALELLKNFLRGPQRMALVVDEFGGVEGLITLEDVIEEVFGEIYDEFDDDIPAWEEIEPGIFIAQGSTHLSVVSRWLGIKIEADGVDTLSGWLTVKLGALPRVEDHYSYAGYFFQVEKMQRLKVSKVLVRDERRRRK